MAYEGYQRLRVAREGRIVTATIDNPPINLITLELFGELAMGGLMMFDVPRRNAGLGHQSLLFREVVVGVVGQLLEQPGEHLVIAVMSGDA